MPTFPSALKASAVQTALVIVDMMSSWDFPDADKLVRGALPIASLIAALKWRCQVAGLPIIYANDNYGQWRSDFATGVERSKGSRREGATITRMLLPQPDDYFVLKPKHSAFFRHRSNCCCANWASADCCWPASQAISV